MQRIIVEYGPETFPKLLSLLGDKYEMIQNDVSVVLFK
jgi:hypothetical protein